MKFLLLVASLAVAVSSYALGSRDILTYTQIDPTISSLYVGDYYKSFVIAPFTCDRHVVTRCVNILGQEVDENGHLKIVEIPRWHGRNSLPQIIYPDISQFPVYA